MWALPIRKKDAESCAKAMSDIFKNIEKQFPDFKPAYILSGDGSEFKSLFTEVLESRKIKNIRTLGGQPQSNGLVERANGKLKMLLTKKQYIQKGGWVKNLKPCVEIYNNYVKISTGFTPKQALALNSEDEKELRMNVKKSQKCQKRHPHQI